MMVTETVWPIQCQRTEKKPKALQPKENHYSIRTSYDKKVIRQTPVATFFKRTLRIVLKSSQFREALHVQKVL